jgi:autotransporter-associated beta strand protein
MAGQVNVFSGSTILTGTNLYSGGTTIAAGATLQLGNGGATGSIIGDVVDNGTLAVNRTGVLTLAGDISGTGNLTLAGGGALVLTGTNTYSGGTTINAGTLQLGNGGTSGSIVGNVVDNGVFQVNRSDVFSFGGVISGTGSFRQIGTGTTILTGINSYSGGTTIAAGTLAAGADNNLGFNAQRAVSEPTCSRANARGQRPIAGRPLSRPP